MSPDSVLVINPQETRSLLSLEEAVTAVQTAYSAHADGDAKLFPFVRERLGNGAVAGIKSGYWASRNVIGLKLAGYWPQNSAEGRPNHQAGVLLAEAATGRLLALIDGNAITELRTVAAGVLAARLLAGSRRSVLAILGCGAQGRAQAEGMIACFPSLTEIRLWDRRMQRADELAEVLRATGGLMRVSVAQAAGEATRTADIIVTATGSTTALIGPDDVSAPAHVNAMGSDTAGKRELAVALVEASDLIVDDREQSRLIGEAQPPVRLIEDPATIGEVILGRRPGRTAPENVTVFDSTGIGLQDVAAAEHVYRSAISRRMGTVVSWPSS